MTSHSKRIRKKPNGPENDGWEAADAFEQRLYQILHASYERADASARVTARLEYELARDLGEQQEDGDEKELTAEAAMREVGSEFDHSMFESMFSNLNTLKLLDDLLALLGMEEIRSDVLHAVIDDRFKTRAPKSIDRTAPIIGSDAEVLLHNIKKGVELRQRQNGTPKA